MASSNPTGEQESKDLAPQPVLPVPSLSRGTMLKDLLMSETKVLRKGAGHG
jgi:hypothetical protein